MDLMYIMTGAAVLVSFLLTLLIGRFVLMELRKLKAGQEIREDGPKWHAGKAGTPTMGGIMFILGAGVVVLPGVTIGDNTVIGAGSVVTKDIPANVVAVGNPCRVLRAINERDRDYYFKDRRTNAALLK